MENKKTAKVPITKASFFIFLGLVCFFNGILGLLISTRAIPFTFKQLWPLCVILTGVSMFLASMFYTHRIRSVYLFPSIVIVVLGGCLLPFSLHLIKDSLSAFVLKWWPAILVAVGIVLIILFIAQQVNHKDFPYMTDDSLVEDDE